MLALVQFARGRGAVAHQRYDDGYVHLRRILEPTDVAYHPFVGGWALADLIEAAVHTGRRAEADVYNAHLESLAAKASAPCLVATLGYARAIAAEESDAEALYQAALSGELGVSCQTLRPGRACGGSRRGCRRRTCSGWPRTCRRRQSTS